MNSQVPPRWYNPVRWQWSKRGRGYRRFMEDPAESSTYLREEGLKPTLARILGDCSHETLLDVGAGGAWLGKLVRPARYVAFDLARPVHVPKGIEYREGDAADLPYRDPEFDTVVTNLMLCYCADLLPPLREMARVTKPGGRLIVSTVHPHFYRTGEGNDNGTFTVTADLRRSRPMSILIGNRVGPFRYFYHPYPDYLNAMTAAGWVLRHAEDWFYDREEYGRHFSEEDSVRRSPLVPIFTFFVCDKPR